MVSSTCTNKSSQSYMKWCHELGVESKLLIYGKMYPENYNHKNAVI